MMVHIQSQHLGGGGRRIMSFSHFQLHAKFKDSLVYSKELLVGQYSISLSCVVEKKGGPS